jgi:hypothetical protein
MMAMSASSSARFVHRGEPRKVGIPVGIGEITPLLMEPFPPYESCAIESVARQVFTAS